MKNQLDLIITIVSVVLAAIGGIVLFVTKPEPVAPSAAPTATLSPVSVPEGKTLVQFQNGLPGATGGAAGGFGGGFPGFGAGSRGGPAGFAGAPGAGGGKKSPTIPG